jgi:hypothetical protein
MSLGLEAVPDIIRDLEEALNSLKPAEKPLPAGI